jgi:hypothetical protein
MKVTGGVNKTKDAQPRVVGPSLKVESDRKASKKPTPRYNVRTISEKDAAKLVIDGKPEEPTWMRLPKLKLTPFGSAPRIETWAKAFVTETHLYVGASLEDTHIWGTLTSRDDATWTQEVLELFLDVNGDGRDYMELQITPTGTVFDAHFAERLGRGKGSRDEQINAAKAWNLEGLEHKVFLEGTANNSNDQDQKWMVEFKVPLASIPGFTSLKDKDAQWAVNFYRFDRPDEKTTHAYAWSTAPQGDFHQVDKFGTFRFVGKQDLAPPQLSPEVVKSLKRNINLKNRPPVNEVPTQKPTPAK